MAKGVVATVLAGVGFLVAMLGPAAGEAIAADRDCSGFANQAEAQSFFERAGRGDPHRLDADGDGVACESLPCPCGKQGGSQGDSPSVPAKKRMRGRVAEVVDGDTLKVKLGRSDTLVDVRLIGIDTPETKRPATPVECGGRAASALMTKLASGRGVTLVTDASQDRYDRYGRLLAYAVRGDGLDLNLAMLRRGWAAVYVYDNNPFARVARYRRGERAARAARRGVWARCGGDFHRPA